MFASTSTCCASSTSSRSSIGLDSRPGLHGRPRAPARDVGGRLGRRCGDGDRRQPGGAAGPPAGLSAPVGRNSASRAARKRRSRSELATTKRLEAPSRRRRRRVEVAGRGERERGDVVGEGPEEVALDRASVRRERRIASAAAQVAGHERDVGRLDRDVGAGADRDPEVGLGERGRVVDAVADHGDDRPRPAAAARRRPSRRGAPRRARRRARSALRRARGRARCRRSAGSVRSPSSRAAATASRARRLDGVGDDEQRPRRAVPAGGDRRAALGLGGRSARARDRAAASATGRRSPAAPAPDDDRAARRPGPATPSPARLLKSATSAGRRLRRRAAAAIARAIGCSEASSSAPASRSACAS